MSPARIALMVSLLAVASCPLPAQQPTNSSAAPTPTQSASVSVATPDDLEGHEWLISQFYANEMLRTVALRGQWPKPYFDFLNGRIEGSLGCGQFTGTYFHSGYQLAISAKWADASGTSCNDGEKDDAAKMLLALANVRAIRPVYDALLLENMYGDILVRLAPMQPGKDLSELHDTFWHLKQLDGSTADFSQVVINIDEAGITLSTPSYSIRRYFQYHLLTGLKFQISPPDYQQVANAFEHALQIFASYETKQGNLIFYDKDRQPLIVLNPIQSTGIENRKWRIAKYRGDGSGQMDKDGLIDAKVDASVLFLNGRVEGSSGLGMWVGTYTLSGDNLTFDAGNLYAGAFTEEQSEQGYLVSKAFKGDRRIEQRGNQMLLRDKSGQAQILLVPSVMPVQQPATPKPELSAQQPIKPTHSAASAPTQTGIVNRMWRIVKVRADEPSKAESDGLIDKKDDAYVILMDGRVTGTMGCGGLSGTYKLSGNELTLDASAILVDTGCPDLNAPYTSGSSMWFPYKSELRIEQRGNQFLLRDKSGKVQLLLVPY